MKDKKNRVHIHLWFKKGSSSSTVNTGEVLGDVSRTEKALLHVLLGIWNQNSNTVINEKCCSYLSISIFTVGGLYPQCAKYLGIHRYRYNMTNIVHVKVDITAS